MELSTEVAAVMQALLERADELVERVLEDVWGGVEEYRDALGDKTELGRVVRRSIEAVLAATAEQRSVSSTDLEHSEQIGQARALQGFAASSLLQSYRAGERCLVDSFLHTAAHLDGPGCGEGVRALAAAFDQLERAATLAHRRTEQAVALAHETAVASLLTQLASGVGIDVETLGQHAAVIDIELHRSYIGVAVLMPASTDPQRLPSLRRHIARRIAELERAKVPSVMWQGLMLFLVPRQAPDDQLGKLLRRIVTDAPLGDQYVVGVGEPSLDLVGSSESFRHAAAAAHLGSQRRQLGEVIVYADVVVEVLLAANQDAAHTLIRRRLGDLIERPGLIRTLCVYLDHGPGLRACADALGIHVNTVSYRLRQIERIARVDMRRARDLADLETALRAMELVRLPSQRASG